MENNKYISFEGKRVKTYWIRGEYCVIDKDLAKFFEISKKYLLFTKSCNKDRSSKLDVFEINNHEYQRIKLADNKLIYDTKHKVYAFNLKGIITAASRLFKSNVATKLSIWVIRTITNNGMYDIFNHLIDISGHDTNA